MPSEYKPVERQQRHIIGCRIKPGVTPGGFTKTLPATINANRKRRPISAEAVKAAAAANDALARRGVFGESFRDA